MNLLIILFLVLLLLLFRKRRIFKILLIITLVFSLLVSTRFLPHTLLKNLQNSYINTTSLDFGKENAIVLLGAGTTKVPYTTLVQPSFFAYSRIYTAAKTYDACKQTAVHCYIVLSGGDAVGSGTDEASVYAKALHALNIPTEDLILESKSLNTFQNAQYVSEILKNKLPDHIFLVTSSLHLKRSLLYFEFFGVKAIPVGADYFSTFSSLPNASNIFLTDAALHEYTGILRFYIYNTLGLNKK